MAITFNGTELKEIIFNGVSLDKVIYNGVEVWTKGIQGYKSPYFSVDLGKIYVTNNSSIPLKFKCWFANGDVGIEYDTQYEWHFTLSPNQSIDAFWFSLGDSTINYECCLNVYEVGTNKFIEQLNFDFYESSLAFYNVEPTSTEGNFTYYQGGKKK